MVISESVSLRFSLWDTGQKQSLSMACSLDDHKVSQGIAGNSNASLPLERRVFMSGPFVRAGSWCLKLCPFGDGVFYRLFMVLLFMILFKLGEAR